MKKGFFLCVSDFGTVKCEREAEEVVEEATLRSECLLVKTNKAKVGLAEVRT